VSTTDPDSQLFTKSKKAEALRDLASVSRTSDLRVNI
jgi:hypothetical protein